jgi:hypothetical protein
MITRAEELVSVSFHPPTHPSPSSPYRRAAKPQKKNQSHVHHSGWWASHSVMSSPCSFFFLSLAGDIIKRFGHAP